jgi:hypothetical protein
MWLAVRAVPVKERIMQIDQDKIEKAIVQEAVDSFVNNEDLYQRVKVGIAARIDKIFAEQVQSIITATVDRITKDGFEREYVKRDAFGKAAGEPTSISKELERLISHYWDTRVGRDGKPTESSYSSTSRAEWMMMQICADDFSKEMKQHVVNVGGALKDHFRGVLHAHIASLLSDVFKVNTAQDKAERNKGGSATIHPPAMPIG